MWPTRGMLVFARLLAARTSSRASRRSSRVPRARAAGHLPRLRKRQADFRGLRRIGVDAYNPLEAKAGLDVVELRRRYRPPNRLLRQHGCDRLGGRQPGKRSRRVVLTKLNAAKGGGYIFQSDHSVPANISGETTTMSSTWCGNTEGIRCAWANTISPISDEPASPGAGS